MQSVLSREQVRAVDRHAIDVCRVPSLTLMENAGRGAAEVVERRLGSNPGRVVVVAGPGNNGGDGFVVARRLALHGREARVLLAARRERLTGDALANHDAWVGVGGRVETIAEADLSQVREALAGADVVVDALFGTGLDREVTGFFASLITELGAVGARVVALDVPSGMDANTGVALGPELRVAETVTFAALKLGLVTSTGAERAGRVTVVDIGIPDATTRAVGQSACVLERADVAAWLPRRGLAAHKGSAGRVLCAAGSPGKTGAALLAARGALRAGAGLVTIAALLETADALDRRVLEEMTARIDATRIEESLTGLFASADVVVVGPGVGRDARARRIVDHAALHFEGTVVVDADGLTHFAGRLAELRGAKGRVVLTPHPGEMARLLGVTTADVERDRFGAVTRAVAESSAVVLLKGARTLVGAPGEPTAVNPTGTPAMATAGSGDVLSGVLGAVAATVKNAFHAACAAAYVHGLSGERWAAATGADRGLLAHELADGVPAALAALTTPR
jgi:hydroxyethylthiazole kinase-like uncharacterized protein yjeF